MQLGWPSRSAESSVELSQVVMLTRARILHAHPHGLMSDVLSVEFDGRKEERGDGEDDWHAPLSQKNLA